MPALENRALRESASSNRPFIHSSLIGFVQEGKLVCNFQHAIERNPRIGGNFGRNDDLIDDASFFQVFEHP